MNVLSASFICCGVRVLWALSTGFADILFICRFVRPTYSISPQNVSK